MLKNITIGLVVGLSMAGSLIFGLKEISRPTLNFNDRVQVINGFYKDCTGNVYGYIESSVSYKVEIKSCPNEKSMYTTDIIHFSHLRRQ